MNEDSVFCNYLRYRQHFSFNTIIIVVGDKRMGKSFLACALGEMMDAKFNVDNIVFDLDAFLDFVDKAEPCWLVYDEIGVTLDRYTWFSTENRIFGQCAETYGKLGINLIMTLPKLEMLSKNGLAMCDFFINMLRRGIGRIYINRKYPLDIHGKFRTPILGHMVDASPSPELWKVYEEKKMAYLKSLTKGWKEQYKTTKLKAMLTSKRIRNKVEQDTNPMLQIADSDIV